MDSKYVTALGHRTIGTKFFLAGDYGSGVEVSSVSQGAAVPAACRSPTFPPASKQLLHMKPATLDFMLFDVDLVDCFVAAAAAGLGTVIGSLLSVRFHTAA